ncbi:GNAT family N-acetyltransferase [Ferruginibacter sp.]
MYQIQKASLNDAAVLSPLAIQTFLQSHGHSAPQADINSYIAEKYTEEKMQEELNESANIYHILYYNQTPAGFSKIIYDHPFTGSTANNICKLERIYILNTYFEHKLGQPLLQYNINLAKQQQQAGMWLYVWKENNRAVNFYGKNGFQIIGSYDFKVSATHSNPNHQMLLLF